MNPPQPQVCRAQVNGFVAYLSILLRLIIGAVYLPFYAVVAFGAWWLNDWNALAWWEFPTMLALYWISESVVCFLLARRADRRPARLRGPIGRWVPPLLSSTGAWAVASGLDLRATLLGAAVGLVFCTLDLLYDSVRSQPSEEEQREAVRALSGELVQAMVEHKQEKDARRERKQTQRPD
jgi:hypothetical protein